MTITSVNPRTGATQVIGEDSTATEVAHVCAMAGQAVQGLEALGRGGRARLLRDYADRLGARRTDIVAIADRETALGEARLNNELNRSIYQLQYFAMVIEEGAYLEATIDHPGETAMGPRPDTRRMLVPIGAAGIFGASNFPLAFSVPGGDTASALAAGSPVVIKAHSAHPVTSQLCFDCLSESIAATGAPEGTAALVFGRDAGTAVVTDPHIKAVGFTGSLRAGRTLADLAASRPEPIPFFGELGSINPLVVAPGVARQRAAEIASGYIDSITLGAGQFCTKPGLAFMPAQSRMELQAALSTAIESKNSTWLLTGGIADAFAGGVDERAKHPDVEMIGSTAQTTEGFSVAPVLFVTTASHFLDAPELLTEECFGPTAVVVFYENAVQLQDSLRLVPGSLTGTIHANADDAELTAPVLALLRERVGRIVWNAYPTGVHVNWAMTHGGPWPAASSSQHTSVGSTAIRRFLRPLTYQNAPEGTLPPELRDDFRDIPRRIDGALSV